MKNKARFIYSFDFENNEMTIKDTKTLIDYGDVSLRELTDLLNELAEQIRFLEEQITKMQKEKEISQKFIDALEQDNLDLSYESLDARYEMAQEMANDWEQGYKERIAELEEQLKNALRPTFQLGQQVYDAIAKSYWEVQKIEFEKHNDTLYEIYRLGHKGTDDYNCCVLPSDYNYFFATREDAEKRLAELKGEGK